MKRVKLLPLIAIGQDNKGFTLYPGEINLTEDKWDPKPLPNYIMKISICKACDGAGRINNCTKCNGSGLKNEFVEG